MPFPKKKINTMTHVKHTKISRPCIPAYTEEPPVCTQSGFAAMSAVPNLKQAMPVDLAYFLCRESQLLYPLHKMSEVQYQLDVCPLGQHCGFACCASRAAVYL